MVNNPNIRFTGFSDEWEDCKLGDVLSIPEKIKANVTESRDLMTLKMNLGGLKLGASRETLMFGAGGTTYHKRKAGQFIYGMHTFFKGSMAIIPPELDGKATSVNVPSFDISGIDPNYLYTYVSRRDYWKSKEALASGTCSKRINEATLFGFDISVPTLNEQEKIGSLFSTFDQKIGLEERQIELLKDLKKGLHQNLFI